MGKRFFMTDESFTEKVKRERELATDALKKLGYVKSTQGWILKSRLEHCLNEGLVHIHDKRLCFTSKGTALGSERVNAYLTGTSDKFT